MYIPSVEEAAKIIATSYNQEDFDKLKEVIKYLKDNEVAKTIAGNASEFHNATVHLTRVGCFDYAYALAMVGHVRYPKNTDLLGDLLCYGLRCRTYKELEQWYNELDAIMRRFWTWRAYQFSFDYWMERLPEAENDAQLIEWQSKIEKICDDFIANFKYLTDQSDREKAYVMKFEYYNSIGDEKEAIKTLVEATTNPETANKCAQCALKLADRYFELGDYENSYKYAKKAIEIKEDQPSINLGYTNYILAMSLEWIKRENNSIARDIKQVYSAYYSAYIYLRDSNRIKLMDSVEKQVRKLEFEYGEPSNIPFDNDGGNRSLLRLLQSDD